MVQDSISIGKITYAIDHNTKLLAEGKLFKSVEVGGSDKYSNVAIKFDGSSLVTKYITRAQLEVVVISKGNNGHFNLQFDSYKIQPGVSVEQATNPHPSLAIAKCRSRFNDLRRVEYQLQVAGKRNVIRNETDKDGKVSLVQFRTVAKQAGFSIELFNELVVAFRNYLRNKESGVLPEVKEAKKIQSEKTNNYQTERRESTRELAKAMSNLRSYVGLEEVKDAPTISVAGVQSFISSGAIDVAKKTGKKAEILEVLKTFGFSKESTAKEKYKSAVSASAEGRACLDEILNVLKAQSRVSPKSGTPTKDVAPKEKKEVNPDLKNMGEDYPDDWEDDHEEFRTENWIVHRLNFEIQKLTWTKFFEDWDLSPEELNELLKQDQNSLFTYLQIEERVIEKIEANRTTRYLNTFKRVYSACEDDSRGLNYWIRSDFSTADSIVKDLERGRKMFVKVMNL